MIGRRTIFGLCMLCALLVSAIAAQSASAITGTTAFTCSKGAGTLRGEHCLTTGSAGAEYGHVIVFQDTTTDLKGTNAKTESETNFARPLRLKVTIAGVPLELQATGVSLSGWMENRLANSVHYVWGAGGITFTGVTVKSPASRECQVYTDNEATKTEGEVGVIHTRELRADTYAWGDALHLNPLFGESFANFFITCGINNPPLKIPAIEGTWECIGSVNGVPNGATVDFTHATVTAENTLKCKGSKAGIDGSLTLEGSAKGAGSYKPLAATTVSTG